MERRAAFAKNPTGPNQVWQLDFWRVGDYPRRNLARRRMPGLVLESTSTLFTSRRPGTNTMRSPQSRPHWPNMRRPSATLCGIYAGSMRRPGNCCPWSPSSPTTAARSGRPYFQIFIASHPELRLMHTKKNSPGQNGSCERGFGALKCARLFLDDIPDALTLAERAEDYRVAGSKLPLRSLGTSIVTGPTLSVRTVSVRVPLVALHGVFVVPEMVIHLFIEGSF